MLHTFKIRLFFVFCLCFFLQAYAEEGKYYCRADKDFKNYQNGFIKDLALLKGFDSKETCEGNCFVKKTCAKIPQEILSSKLVDSNKIDLKSINETLKNNQAKMQGLEIIIKDKDPIILKDDNFWKTYELFRRPYSYELKKTKIRALITPNIFKISIDGQKDPIIIIDKNSLNTPALKANYITRDKKDYTSITKKILTPEKTIKNIDEIKEGKVDFYQLVGITYNDSEVNINNAGNLNVIPLEKKDGNLVGEEIINYEGVVRNDLNIGGKKIGFITRIDGADLEKDTEYSINYNGQTYNVFEINLLIKKGNSDYYTCSGKRGLKGDLGEDVFSSREVCEAACVIPATCQFEAPKKPFVPEEDCTIEEQFLDGVGDIDGKFVYQTKKIVKTCKKSRKKQVGCELYDYKTTYASNVPDYLKNSPQVETNLENGDFSKGMAVFAKASAAEQVAHMFSGESNYCDSGTFFDSPNWVEMGIKYSMMIISASATSSGFGEAYGSAKDAAKEAGDSAFKGTMKGLKEGFNHIPKGLWETTVKNFTKEGFKTMGEQMLKNFAVVAASKLATNFVKGVKKIVDDIKFREKYNKWEREYGAAYLSQQASAGANQKGIKSYEDLNGAINKDDEKAAKYASCMTGKFNLYPEDVINYSLGINPDDLDDPEAKERLENLSFPSKSSVRIEAKDLGVLIAATNDDNANTLEEKRAYMEAHYSIKTEGEKNDIILLRSLTPDDYRIAAETICGGEESIVFIRQKYGARFLNPDLKKKPDPLNPPKIEVVAPPPPTKDKDEDEPFTFKEAVNKAIDMALQSLPFPYNMIGSLLKDYVDLYSQGNTCFNEDFAKKRKAKDNKNGEMFVKTNKRIASDLCFETRVEKNIWKDWAVSSLTKDRTHYCCYDQKLTKIFAQGILEQLGRPLNGDNCSNITPADLDNISFNECENGQDPKKDKCFPKNRFNELTETILQGGSIGSDDLLKNIIKSTIQLKEKLEDPTPIDSKDIIDLSKDKK